MRVGMLARLLSLVLIPAALTACGGRSVSDSFGMQRRSPDEFQVVRRAPLIVPPDASLRPPAPGTEGPAVAASTNDAYAALTGSAPSPSYTSDLSPAQEALVERAPGKVLPNIRQIVAQEDSQSVVLDRGTFLFILSWQRGAYQQELAARDTLDPVRESRRLESQGIVQTARTSSTPVMQ